MQTLPLCHSYPRTAPVWLLFGLLILAAALPVLAVPSRGYQARACGFDLDFDGVAGEAADCAAICRGGAADADVDGNGVADRTVYVDCSGGADTAGCGSATSPCRTIQFALDGGNTAFSHRIRSPAAAQIQAVCFTGTCAGATFEPSWSGAAGVYARPLRGSETRAFELPRYPLIVSGWDRDGDGVFPPMDPQDPAVLDGQGSTSMAITNPQVRSRFEIAHFAARDYGGCGGDAGFFEAGTGYGADVTHTYLHDLELARIAAGCGGGFTASGRIVFPMWAPGGYAFQWGAFVNIDIDGYGAYIARGAGGGGESGPFRFQNLSAAMNAASGDAVFGFKMWDFYSRIEILDSVFDGAPRDWTPDRTTMVVAAQCSRDWMVRNNEFIDLWLPINVQGNGDAGVCNQRNVDDVVIDGNLIRNTYAPYAWGDIDILVGSGAGTSSTGTIEDVTITNNFLSSTTEREAAVRVQVGHDGGGAAPGTIIIANNTFDGGYNRDGGIVILATGASRQQRFEVHNNIFSNLGAGDPQLFTDYAPGAFDSDFNVFDQDGVWIWNWSQYNDLASWRGATGGDAGSRLCNPQYVARASGDLHLAAGDTCASDRGAPSAAVDRDIDGDARGQGAGWEIGADEIAAAAALFTDGFESGDTSAWMMGGN